MFMVDEEEGVLCRLRGVGPSLIEGSMIMVD